MLVAWMNSHLPADWTAWWMTVVGRSRISGFSAKKIPYQTKIICSSFVQLWTKKSCWNLVPVLEHWAAQQYAKEALMWLCTCIYICGAPYLICGCLKSQWNIQLLQQPLSIWLVQSRVVTDEAGPGCDAQVLPWILMNANLALSLWNTGESWWK